MMDKETVKLRLIEAAAQLPAVRAGMDASLSAEAAIAVSRLWYNYVMEDSSRKPAPKKAVREKLSLKK